MKTSTKIRFAGLAVFLIAYAMGTLGAADSLSEILWVAAAIVIANLGGYAEATFKHTYMDE